MDFVAYEPSGIFYTLLGVIVISCVAALVAGLIFNQPLLMFGLIVVAAVALVVNIILPSPYGEWQKEVKAEVKDTYGLKLTDGQLKKLKYPYSGSEPDEDFKQYGSITVVKPDGDKGFEKTEVYLLWNDGKMILASPDEQKKLQPLKIRD